MLAACGEVDVIQHGSHPDATLDAGAVPSAPPPASAFSGLAPPPPAAVVAGLRLDGLDGTPASLASLRGHRATVVAFFASYCTPCIRELPGLEAMTATLARQGVAMVLVDYREDAATVRRFLGDHDVRAAAYLDGDGSAHDGLGLLGVPTTAVLGPDGSVLQRIEGSADNAGLVGVLGAMGVSAQ